MDEFVLGINKDKFRSTNAKWNELMLNDPWSVGYVSTLIEASNWKSKEEWEETYYASGAVRNRLMPQNWDTQKNSSMIRLCHTTKLSTMH